MFCLDYAFAFVAHYGLCHSWFRLNLGLPSSPFFTFPAGGIAGAAAAVALFPFDVVRHEVLRATGSSASPFAFSIIPFMSAYLGVYFLQNERQQTPLSIKASWAFGATSLAAALELPFDRAKISMAGGIRNAAVTNALRVPLGTGLLLAYDKILTSSLITLQHNTPK
mmetsp:Transcript_75087/g.125165  ORF Transcript_75087/g.125165 Transcript_75087/m.125165 type:complete len:167 (+) Transcript_75087:179-679(+)